MGEVSKRRRKILAGFAGGLGAIGAGDSRPLAPDDPTKLQGPPPTEVGERSPFETPRRTVMKNEPASSSRTPLQNLTGIVTPSDLHFERHHAGVPRIDPERYTLLIHGLVERPRSSPSTT
jgi:sulfane dehydrogenase subunit SoxC